MPGEVHSLIIGLRGANSENAKERASQLAEEVAAQITLGRLSVLQAVQRMLEVTDIAAFPQDVQLYMNGVRDALLALVTMAAERLVHVRKAERALRREHILPLLFELEGPAEGDPEGMTFQDIVKRVGAEEHQVADSLRRMKDRGWVEEVEGTHRYRLTHEGINEAQNIQLEESVEMETEQAVPVSVNLLQEVFERAEALRREGKRPPTKVLVLSGSDAERELWLASMTLEQKRTLFQALAEEVNQGQAHL